MSIDCSGITFVMASRNDGYSCLSKNDENEQRYKIEVTINSAMMSFPNSKFILVDFCPIEGKKRLNELVSAYTNLKVVTVKPQLLIDLQNKCPNEFMNFYEFVAKHIGQFFVETDNIIFVNQDTILIDKDVQSVVNDIRDDKIVVAWKDKIDYSYMNYDILSLYLLCNNDNHPIIKEHGAWGNGDFLGISKKLYNDIGGYAMVHQNWATDNEILWRVGLKDMITLETSGNIQITRPYSFFCLDHITDGWGRSREEQDFVKISPEIVSRLIDYVE